MSDSENASYVIGQINFTDTGSATTQSNLNVTSEASLAFDKVNQRLFVADQMNHRVLVFNVAPGVIANGMNASYELGQPAGPTAFTSNTGGGGQDGLNEPIGLAYDSNNSRLFVSGGWTCRVMVFNVAPGFIKNGMNAINVIGQPDFASGCSGYPSASNFGYHANQLYYDVGSGRLFVGDYINNRVLVFDASTVPSQF